MKILTIIIVLNGLFSYGQSNSFTGPSFIENKGQIIDQNGEKNKGVLYLFSDSRGLNTQLKKDGFSYDVYSVSSDSEKSSIEFNRIDVQFKNYNEDVEIIPIGLNKSILNYYNLNYEGTSLSNIKSYKSVIYKEIYKNIDVVFTSLKETSAIKYDIILHPGANIKDIQFLYKGFNKMKINEQEQLELDLDIRILKESIPHSFYKEDNEIEFVHFVALEMSRNQSLIGFALDNQLVISKTLIIDPVPNYVWGKYIGDSLETSTNGVITDRFNNVYICGGTQSLANIATSGSYQSSINDSIGDAYISKYHKSGTLLWSTYFGGDAIDVANDVYVDTSFNVIITGTTYSPTGVSDSLSYQDSLGGDADAFLAKFDESGALVWSTYFGGDSTDFGTKLSVDFYENIYMCGTTNSINNISSTGAFQQNLSGEEDGFFAKFNSAGVLQWSSYIGGTSKDVATSIAYGDTSVYISGQTYSTDFPTNGSTLSDSLNGLSDGFITRIDNNGQGVWSTYFGGENADVIQSVKVLNNNIYFIGTTDSYADIANIMGVQNLKNDSTDAFIGKLSNDDSLIWCTYFGGDSLDYGVDLFFELDSSIIAVGTTNSANLFGVDSNSHQEYNNGGTDAFLTKFSPDGLFRWSSYYGGSNDDVANAVAVYGNTAIYIVGNTFSDSLLIDTNQLNSTNVFNSIQEGFFTKFNQNRSTASSGINTGGGPGTGTGTGTGVPTGTNGINYHHCPGEEILLSTQGGDLGTDANWFWYENSCGSSSLIGTGDSIYVYPMVSTSYYVRAESVTNSTSCSSIYKIIAPISNTTITSNSVACAGEDYLLEASGNGTIEWIGPNSFTYNQFDTTLLSITDTSAGWYYIELIDTFNCVYQDSMELSVMQAPNVATSFTEPSCFQYNNGSIIAESNAILTYNFEWINLNSLDTLIASDSLLNLTAGEYSLTILDSNNCTYSEVFVLDAPPSILNDTIIIPSSCNDLTGAIIFDIDSIAGDYTISVDSILLQSDSALYLGYGWHSVDIVLENGCEESHSIFIGNENNLSVSINSVSPTFCAGNGIGSAIATGYEGLPPYTFEWLDIGITDSIATGLDTGLYIVAIYDSALCFAFDSVYINAVHSIVVTDNVIPSLCSDSTGSISLAVENPSSTYTINFSNGVSNQWNISNLMAGSYEVIIADTFGCYFQMTYLVDIINDLEVLIFPNDTIINSGDSIQITTTVNYLSPLNYEWNPPANFDCATCPNPIVEPSGTVTYQLIVSDTNGCIDTAFLNVEVNKPFNKCIEVFIPTMFSPNNDKTNDVWSVIGGCIGDIETRVYNSWGELIFESFDQSMGWDGFYKGSKVQNGQYAYIIKIRYANGEEELFSGFMTVID
tara:strand:+ start:10844 stop:14932 length:4089 start_codon:yes stop_codon:yes gene_type:complete